MKRDTAVTGALITAWVFFVYRHGLYSLPRGDQLPFLREHTLFPDTGTWLLHALSYNRSRVLTGDAHYLFRPLHSFTLGLEEVLFRDDALLQGIASIALHAAAALVLYALVRSVAGPIAALVASIVFATQYAGMEMVVWRHISPYLWVPIFLGLGLHTLSATRSWRASVPWLVLGSLAHEVVPIAFVLAIAALVLVRRRSVDRPKLDAVVKALAMAFAIWLALDLVDLAIHPKPTMALPDAAMSFSAARAASGLVRFLGLCTLAALVPSAVDLRWNGPEGAFSRLQWDYTVVPEPLAIGLGILALGLLGSVVVRSASRIARGDGKAITPLVLASFVLALAVGFTAARTASRSFGYFANATYYFHFTSFVFLALAGGPVSRASRLVKSVAAVLAALWTFTSYACIQKALLAQEPFARLALTSAATVRAALAERPDVCIGGVLDPDARELLAPAHGPLALFGETACPARRGARGLYLDRVGGRYALVSLPPPADLAPYALEATPDWSVGATISARPGTVGPVSIFGADVRPTEVDVRIEHAQDGGLWLGHRSMRAYTGVTFFDGAHVQGTVRDGDAPPGQPFQELGAIVDPSFDLRVRLVDSHALVLYGATVIGDLGARDLSGRVGLLHYAGGAQAFRDLRVGQAELPEPTVELPLDLDLSGLPAALAALAH